MSKALIGLAVLLGLAVIVYKKGYDNGNQDGYRQGYSVARKEDQRQMQEMNAEIQKLMRQLAEFQEKK